MQATVLTDGDLPVHSHMAATLISTDYQANTQARQVWLYAFKGNNGNVICVLVNQVVGVRRDIHPLRVRFEIHSL